MLTTFLSISSLLFGIAILLLGSGLMGTLLSLRGGMEGFSDTTTGIVMSGFFVGYIVGSYLSPRLVRRVGHIRVFAAYAAIAAVSVMLHGLWIDPWFWWVLRVISGVCSVGIYLAVESWLSVLVPHSRRGRLYAVYTTVNLLALGAGQYLLLPFGPKALETFVLAGICFVLALVPVALTRVDPPPTIPAPQLQFRRLLQISPLGAMGAFATGLGNGAFWGLSALFGHKLGLTPTEIAMFVSAVIFGGALLQWPIGHLSDTHDRRIVLAFVCLFGFLSMLAAYAVARVQLQGLIVSGVFYGGFSFAVYSLAVAHANDHLKPEEILDATRGLLLLNGIGAAIGPVAAGYFMAEAGAPAFLLFLGGTLALLGLFAAWRMLVSAPVAVEQQAAFVPMARTPGRGGARSPRRS
jgi:MFS family permease